MPDLFPREHAIEPLDGDKGREERGAYFTPAAMALAISKSVRALLVGERVSPRSIFEPGCGAGAFLRAAAETWPTCSDLYGVDLEPACTGPGVVERRDLFHVERPFDLSLGNPDFAIGEEVVRRCLRISSWVALLLLSDFEGSDKRVPFWREHPLYARQAIGGARASFREDGQTDMRPYSLFVWRQGWHGPEYRGLPPLLWKGPR